MLTKYKTSRTGGRPGHVTVKTEQQPPVGLFLMAVLLIFTAMSGSIAHASWLIDQAGFHASAHGQLTCADCHGDKPDSALHPQPAAVNKELSDFFQKDMCLDCHGEIAADLEARQHGGRIYKNPYALVDCLKCHDPHQQLPVTDLPKDFDPDRPAREQCGACHEVRTALPDPDPDDSPCLECHRRPPAGDPTAVGLTDRLCFHCHGKDRISEEEEPTLPRPWFPAQQFKKTPHGALSCLECHPQAAQYRHNLQKTAKCLSCHTRHDEKKAAGAHLTVSCQACHLPTGSVYKDPGTEKILWRKDGPLRQPSRLHDLEVVIDRTACRKCHVAGNPVGAAAMILPAKSIICLPCHPATISSGDSITIIALLIFLAGLAGWVGLLIFAAKEKPFPVEEPIATWADRAAKYITALFWDVLGQRRLWRQSRFRWFVHGLIFYGLLVRFLWGLLGLILSLGKPAWPITWLLLDKNYPATALVFDLTGIMIIFGVFLALWRRVAFSDNRTPGLPRSDLGALALLGALVIVGFILEGLRIAMTGFPSGAEYARLGYALARTMEGCTRMTSIYGWIWYEHALLVGIFVAYLPFSRLFHMITAPIMLVWGAGRRHNNKSEGR